MKFRVFLRAQIESKTAVNVPIITLLTDFYIYDLTVI